MATQQAGIRKQALLLIAIMLLPGFGPQVQIAAAQSNSVTFPETGKTVKGKFLTYWNTHGGLAQQGFPISEEIQEKNDTDGKIYIVQYFERAVFEAHPENQPPYDVLLSLLGTLVYKEKYPIGKPTGEVAPQPGNTVQTCNPTHDDSDLDPGAGFIPEAPARQTVGKGLILTGAVLSGRNCYPIANAKIEMRPEISGQGHPEDQRATLYTDSTGHYQFESRFPEHIHIHVSAYGFKAIITNQYHTTPGREQDSFNITLVPDPSCFHFEQTGQTLCGSFLDYWQKHGGLAQQGYPISSPFPEISSLNGKTYTVQYFERAVFEAHPENQPPYDLLLSLLGAGAYRQKHPNGVMQK